MHFKFGEVLDAEDARRANLNGKKNLDALEIKWGTPSDLQDASIAIDVLDMLRPWTTVKELSIDGFWCEIPNIDRRSIIF